MGQQSEVSSAPIQTLNLRDYSGEMSARRRRRAGQLWGQYATSRCPRSPEVSQGSWLPLKTDMASTHFRVGIGEGAGLCAASVQTGYGTPRGLPKGSPSSIPRVLLYRRITRTLQPQMMQMHHS